MSVETELRGLLDTVTRFFQRTGLVRIKYPLTDHLDAVIAEVRASAHDDWRAGFNKLKDEYDTVQAERDELRKVQHKLLPADALADAVAAMVRLGQIDSRSLAGDALLDYRDPAAPYTDRSEMLARVTRERDELKRTRAAWQEDANYQLARATDAEATLAAAKKEERAACVAVLRQFEKEYREAMGHFPPGSNLVTVERYRVRAEVLCIMARTIEGHEGDLRSFIPRKMEPTV